MASFKKRANGNYQATIYIGRDANGKQLFKYITRPTLKECKAAARLIEQEIEEGKFVNVQNMRLVSWVKEYLETNEKSYAPSTIALYHSYLDNHYEPFFKNLKLNQLNELHIKKFRNYLLDKMTASSANRCLSALKKILADVMKDKSPAKDVALPKPNKPDVKAPSNAEFVEIYKAVQGSRYEIPVLLAAWCGFRRGEILALRVNDIDFDNGTIRIDEAWSKTKEGTYVIKPPKSENGYRTEKAPEELMQKLKEYIRGTGNVIQLRNDSNAFLFDSRPDTFSTSYRNFLSRRKAPKYSFHELRHYHATWLFENDIPDKYAAKRMGQTVEVLKEVYQHLGLKKQAEIDDKILEIAKTAR